MNKRLVFAVGILLIGTVAWTAFGQGGGGRGGFGQMRESQQKAMAALQEQLGKLKAMMEQQSGTQGRNYQDMSDEERTKMREEMTKRREEQAKIMADMQQQMDILKGVRQMATEHQAAMEPLKDLLASAQAEKAKETAAKIEKVIAEKQKQFEAKVTAMGYTMEQVERMGRPRGQQ